MAPPPPVQVRRVTDSNGRAYHLTTDGTVSVSDAGAKKALPPIEPALPKLDALSCGASHCVAVARALGRAYSWATDATGNRFGQLGIASAERAVPYALRHVAMPEGPGRVVVGVAAGDCHSAFVTEAGELYVCGSDRWLQLGQPVLWSQGKVWQREPTIVPKLGEETRVVSAACGSDHTLALDVEGRVWAFGRGEHGQCFGEHTRPFTAAPTVSAALSNLHAGESKGESKHHHIRNRVAGIFARGNCSCITDEMGSLVRCIGQCRGLVQREEGGSTVL